MIDDYIQDALDCLDECEASYVLLICFGKRTIVYSNLGANTEKFSELLKDGHIQKVLEEHLRKR